MLKKIAVVVGYILLFAVIIAVILVADHGANEHRATQQITEFNIYIEGNEENALIDNVVMTTWFDKHGVLPTGRTIAEADLAELERVAIEHSAVQSANAYVTHNGRLDIMLVQRNPILRLRCDGYDRYVAKDGYIFAPTAGCTAYVPIATGDYRFLFDGKYSGYTDELVSDTLSSMQRRIDALEYDKYGIYRERKHNNARLEAVNDSVIYQPFWMSDSKFEQRKEELKIFKEGYAKKHAEADAQLERKISKLTAQQQELSEQIALINQRDDDYKRLLSIVEQISRDELWSAEFTQLIINERSGKMQLSAVTRSGSFVVDLGDTHDIERKLKALHRFYDEVLSTVGWDAYKHISVRYNGQIVCREATQR